MPSPVFPTNRYSPVVYATPSPPAGVLPLTVIQQASLGHKKEVIDLVRDVRVDMEGWLKALGPLEDWSHIFRERYEEACLNTSFKNTQMSINSFLGQVKNHVDYGKSLLDCLGPTNNTQGQWSQVGAADWLLTNDIMSTLHCGVVILEARLDIHAPSGPLPSELQSDICRHKGLEGDE